MDFVNNAFANRVFFLVLFLLNFALYEKLSSFSYDDNGFLI